MRIPLLSKSDPRTRKDIQQGSWDARAMSRDPLEMGELDPKTKVAREGPIHL